MNNQNLQYKYNKYKTKYYGFKHQHGAALPGAPVRFNVYINRTVGTSTILPITVGRQVEFEIRVADNVFHLRGIFQGMNGGLIQIHNIVEQTGRPQGADIVALQHLINALQGDGLQNYMIFNLQVVADR